MDNRFYHMHCLLCPMVTPISSNRADVFNYVESEHWCECTEMDTNFDMPSKRLSYAQTDNEVCICGTGYNDLGIKIEPEKE